MLQNFAKNQRFPQKSALFSKIRKFRKKFANFCDFLQNFATFSKNQLDSFVDLEKPEKMRIWLQNFVSIQPRTSLEKSDASWPPRGRAATALMQLRDHRPSAAVEGCSVGIRHTASRGLHATTHHSGHDTSLFSRLVLGCIETKLCNHIRIL